MYTNGRATKKFYVTEECISCGICLQNCICNTIEMRNNKPIWIRDKCELCLKCLHSCPKSAIQYTKKTEKNGRYINPT